MAKTRLNKALRAQIIENVLKATDFEKMKADIIRRSEVVARHLLQARVPEEFTEMVKGKPATWFRHECRASVMNVLVPAMAFEDQNKWHVTNSWGSISVEPIRVPADFDNSFEKGFDGFSLLRKEAEQLVEKQNKLREDLSAFLYSCTFIEDVGERMPEIKKHIPNKNQFFPPAVNVSNLFTSLAAVGFDNTEAA